MSRRFAITGIGQLLDQRHHVVVGDNERDLGAGYFLGTVGFLALQLIDATDELSRRQNGYAKLFERFLMAKKRQAFRALPYGQAGADPGLGNRESSREGPSEMAVIRLGLLIVRGGGRKYLLEVIVGLLVLRGSNPGLIEHANLALPPFPPGSIRIAVHVVTDFLRDEQPDRVVQPVAQERSGILRPGRSGQDRLRRSKRTSR